MPRAAIFLVICLLTIHGVADDAVNLERAAPQEPPEMITLFNGQDLTGWDGDSRLWKAREGVIHGETTAENKANGNTFLIWKDGTVKDFDLRLSFRCTASNNSGIQYRSQRVAEGPRARNDWVVRGYQHEIRNERDFPNTPSFIYDEGGRRGRICLVGEQAVWDEHGKRVVRNDLIDQSGFNKLMRVDDWNDVVIIAQGNHIRHYLNGVLVVDFTDELRDSAFTEGILALQLHAGNPMWAEFKDIRLSHLD